INGSNFKVDQVIAFLNRDDHSKFRYITLGFGYYFDKVSTYANAGSVDGTYNSARLLPELTAYGAAQLYNAKYFGAEGMDSLRAVVAIPERKRFAETVEFPVPAAEPVVLREAK